MVFNQNFAKVTEGHEQINGAPYSNMPISLNNITINQKGYIYVWVSNESNANLDVFFDDLKVTHTKGHILQEDHYYPFGANISALSSTAPLSKPNRFKANGGTEFNSDFNINTYETLFRGYDAVLGRFNQIDPLADWLTGINPYQFGFNDPISLSDPLGLAPQDGTVLALCPSCPDDSKYDPYKDSPHSFTYIPEISDIPFLSGITVTPTGGYENLPLTELPTFGGSGSSREDSDGSFDDWPTPQKQRGDLVDGVIFGVNTGVGIASTAATIKGGYHLSNELYHYTQSSGNFHWKGSRYWNNSRVGASKDLIAARGGVARNLGTKLGYAGIAITAGDALLSGEFKASQGVNVAMTALAIGVPGVGSIVAGTYFLLDMVFDISGWIDKNTGGTHELYKGFY